jgi:hypothetical protein
MCIISVTTHVIHQMHIFTLIYIILILSAVHSDFHLRRSGIAFFDVAFELLPLFVSSMCAVT